MAEREDSVLMPGTRIAGRYEIRGLLGSGGMAHVYLAWDSTLCREIALKTIRFDRAGDIRSAEILRARLLREAQAAAKLNHPHIVIIHDLCFTSDLPYISMELVQGRNLRDLFDTIHLVPLRSLLQIARQIASALDYAHAHDVVHRDIKPENVMITDDFTAKITDFGIARVQSPDFTTLTTDGKIMCTYHYTAPEYFKGEKGSAQGDLFSFGCLLYEIFTGQLAFSGDSEPQVWWQIMHSTPVAPSMINPALNPAVDPIILALLDRSPDHRPVDCATVVRDLEQALGDRDPDMPIVPEHPVAAAMTVAGSLEERGRPPDATTRVDTLRNPALAWKLAGSGALLGVVLGVAFWWIGNRIAPRGQVGGPIPVVRMQTPTTGPTETPSPTPFHVEQFPSPFIVLSYTATPELPTPEPSPLPVHTASPAPASTRTPASSRMHPKPTSTRPPRTPPTPAGPLALGLDTPAIVTPPVESTIEIPGTATPAPAATQTTPPTARRKDDAWVPF